MDEITRHHLEGKIQQFIASIDRSAVCELASSFHPEKRQCRIFDEEKKGGFNICFPVEFLDATDNLPTGEKWMVRIPLLPRLAFPEEKLSGEIATMKFIAEKTTIPIPQLHGYSLKKDNVIGLPFMLLEYIRGKTLMGVSFDSLSMKEQEKLGANIGSVYLQLFQHHFDHIGAFTLDAEGNWTFGHSRPLSVLMNEQKLAGISDPPNRIYHSTIDYVFMIHQALLDDFHLKRDSVSCEPDARAYLYNLYNSRQFLMEWVKPELNHGPFILKHGDLRSPNIIVNDNWDIMAVLDWEWSHTVPQQMFVPPSWLTGFELTGILKAWNRLAYEITLGIFLRAESDVEYKCHPKRTLRHNLPLYGQLWKPQSRSYDIFIGHALNQPMYFGNVCDLVDNDYYKGGIEYQKRVDDFFNLEIRKPEREALQKKLEDLELFKKECDELGIQAILRLEPEEPKSLKQKELKIQGEPSSREQPDSISNTQSTQPLSCTSWAIAGASLGLAACSIFLALRWNRSYHA